MKGEIVWLPWSPPHVGTKGIPPPGAPCFGGCWRETLLSPHQPEEALVSLFACHRVSGSSPSSPGACWLHICPLVHRTHGVIQASSVAVWLFTQPPGCCCCCCCFVSLSLSVSLCLVYFRIQLHTHKSERQNRCVWLRFLSLVHLHSWGDRAAAAAAASASWQWSYGAHQKPGVPLRPSVAPSLFLLPALLRADQWRGGGAEGARIRWYESGVGPQTCQSHGSGANRGVRRTESAKIN